MAHELIEGGEPGVIDIIGVETMFEFVVDERGRESGGVGSEAVSRLEIGIIITGEIRK